MASLLFITAYDEFALGIRSLSAYLEQFGHKTFLCFLKEFRTSYAPYVLANSRNYQYIRSVNENGVFVSCGVDINPWTKKEEDLLFGVVLDIKPDVVCLSTRNFIDEEICELFARIRRVYPEAVYLAGGFGPTFDPEKYLNVFDFVVRGEGEGAILEIAEAIDHEQGYRIKNFNNVSYRNGSVCVHNPLRPLMEDLDALPFPKLATDGDFYFIEDNMVSHAENAETYSLLIGRGCLNRCSYCCAGEWRSIYKKYNLNPKPYRARNIERVIKEIQRAGESGFRNLNIADSFLAITPEQQRLVFGKIKEYNMRFSAQFHPEMALKNPDIIEYAYDCGLRTTVVGVQHGSERFSREIYNRRNSNETILNWARLVSNFKEMEIQYHFIVGNPLETSGHFEEHLDFINRLKLADDIRVNELSFICLKLFPNTSLSKMVSEKGLYQSIDDAIYKACMSILRFELDDENFFSINKDNYYKEKPLFLVGKMYDNYIKKTRSKLILESNPSRAIFDLDKCDIHSLKVSQDITSFFWDVDNNLVINSSGNDPWIILDNLPLDEQKSYICQCVIETEVKDAILQLFYLPADRTSPGFCEQNSIILNLLPGVNFYRFEIKRVFPVLRLDVSNRPGKYTIHYFIIRDQGVTLYR